MWTRPPGEQNVTVYQLEPVLVVHIVREVDRQKGREGGSGGAGGREGGGIGTQRERGMERGVHCRYL